MVKKRKRATPLMLLWSKREQARFSVATEQAVGLVAELRQLVAELRLAAAELPSPKRRKKAAAGGKTPAEMYNEQHGFTDDIPL